MSAGKTVLAVSGGQFCAQLMWAKFLKLAFLDSLYGRLVALLMASLLLALAAGAWQAEHERALQWRQSRLEHLARRSADLAVLFDRQPPYARLQLARVLSLPWLRIYPEMQHLQAREPLAFSALHQALRRTLGERPWVLFADQGRRVLLQTQLADGSWLSLQLSFEPHPSRWHVASLAPLGLMLLVVLLAALVLARWLARPLEILAKAAKGYAQNRHQAPLPLQGSRELRAAAAAFNQMQNELNAQIDGRAHWFAAMSHDLKTPLTRLRLRAEMLDEPDRSRMIADLSEMQSLLEESLRFLREDQAGQAFETLNVQTLLQTICRDWQEQGHDIRLEGEAKSLLWSNAISLRRIVDNLLQNAILYGKAPFLRLVETVDAVEIWVCDAGAGIPEAELERVFQPYYRLEGSRNRAHGGSGLGLASARRLSHALGGELRLENRAGGGLAAILRLTRQARR